MSVTLHHSIKINASPEQVFRALTDPADMAAWHHGTVEGEIALDSVLYLVPKPGLRFGWKTKELVSNQKLVQECVQGPGSSVGKTLSFTLTQPQSVTTQVDLSDGEWDNNDSSLPFCNTHWGSVLHRLKSHLEN